MVGASKFKAGFRRLTSACAAFSVALSSVVISIAFGALPASAAACVPDSSFSSGTYTLRFTATGTCQWKVPAGVTSGAVLIVGGGGAGGSGAQAGGGGGGQVLYNPNYTFAGGPGTNLNVIVGAGGAKAAVANRPGGKGGYSAIGSITALGGGGGGGAAVPNVSGMNPTGTSGGSGGGASIIGTIAGAGVSGVSYAAQGFASYLNVGGAGVSDAYGSNQPSYGAGGGGGGAMQAGGSSTLSASNVVTLGRAGAGLSLFGSCWGGGGDSSYLSPTNPTFSNASGSLVPTAAVACRNADGSVASGTSSGGFGNTAPVAGSGGGSAGEATSYFDGASGTVIIRYSIPKPSISVSSATGSTDSKPIITGTGVAGLKVRITALGAAWLVDTDNSGNYSVQLGVDAPTSGSFDASSRSVYYEVSARVLDEQDNLSDPNSVNIESLVTEEISDVTANSGKASGGKTYFRDNTPSVKFFGLRNGNTVSVVATNVGSSDTVTGSFTATGTSQNFTMPRLSDGTWNITATHTNPNPSLTRAAAASLTVVIDTVAPSAPSLTRSWAGGASTSATFRFTGESDSIFTCSMDGAESTCDVSKTYTGLAPGDHLFSVVQTDTAGNSSAAVTSAFTVTPNQISSVLLAPASDSGSAGDGITNASAPTVLVSGLYVGSKVTVRLAPIVTQFPDNRAVALCEFTAAAISGTCTFGRVTDGDWQLTATQAFPVGNSSSSTLGQRLTLDSRDPGAVTITGGVPGVWDKDWTFGLVERGSVSFECEFDRVKVACANTISLRALEAGNHTLRVRGVDSAGNFGPWQSVSFETNAGSSPIPTTEPTPSETPTELPTPTPEPSPEPSATDGFGSAVANAAIGATGDDNAPPQEFDPMASEEGIQAVASTASKAVTLVSAVAAAAGAAAAAAGAAAGAAGAAAGAGAASNSATSASSSSSAAGSASSTSASSSVSVDTSSAAEASEASEAEAGEMEQLEIQQDDLTLDNSGIGDRLAFATAAWFTVLDRPTHELSEKSPRFSPLFAKIINDAAYLRAISGPFSLILPLIGIVLGFLAIGSDQHGVLTPLWTLMLAMAVLGVFDALAGFLSGLVFIFGSMIMHQQPLTADDIRLLAAAMLLCIGPSLLTTAFRRLRKRSASDLDGWWERFADLGIAPFMASWVSGSMVASMPALAGVTLPIANHVADVSLALGVAIFMRVWFEEGTSRFFPYRLNRINPDHIVEPSLKQRYISLGLKFMVWIFVSGALVGFTWHIFVGATLTLAPVIATWYQDRFPNSKLLWKILPTGIPGLALKLAIASATTAIAAAVIGPVPELAALSFVILPIPMLVLDVLALFGRHGDQEEEERPIKRFVWLYRLGGIAMFAVVLKLAGVY